MSPAARQHVSNFERNETPLSAIVAQAQGIVSVQAGCTPAQALALMRKRVAPIDLPLGLLAAAVVRGEIRFDGPPIVTRR